MIIIICTPIVNIYLYKICRTSTTLRLHTELSELFVGVVRIYYEQHNVRNILLQYDRIVACDVPTRRILLPVHITVNLVKTDLDCMQNIIISIIIIIIIILLLLKYRRSRRRIRVVCSHIRFT